MRILEDRIEIGKEDVNQLTDEALETMLKMSPLQEVIDSIHKKAETSNLKSAKKERRRTDVQVLNHLLESILRREYHCSKEHLRGMRKKKRNAS